MADPNARRLSPGVVNLLRDLAVAFLIVAVVFAALFAFARTWPPMVVVESGSMQHSNGQSFVGVIDTGDIVVVQDASRREDVVTYAQGRAVGHATYGDYGDVIVFRKPSMPEATPIIHRALLFLVWNEEAAGFDVPTLLDLDPALWDTSTGTPFGLGEGDFVRLRQVGFRSLDITFQIGPFLQQVDGTRCPAGCSGYVTMGDNNAPNYDQGLVLQELVLGRARGELPWFGLLKLVVSGGFGWGDPRAPPNSWTSLTVVLVLLVAGPIALDAVLTLVGRREDRREAEQVDNPPRRVRASKGPGGDDDEVR